MNFKLRYTALATALIAGSFAMNASANVANGTFTVTLVVNKTCAVNTTAASNITLGPVNAGVATTVQSGAFSVNCAKTVPLLYRPGSHGREARQVQATGWSGGNDCISALSRILAAPPFGAKHSYCNGRRQRRVQAQVLAWPQVTRNLSPSMPTPQAFRTMQPGTYTDTITINVNY